MGLDVFVTGGNGFIGRHVVEALLRREAAFRVLLSRPNPDFAARFPAVEVLHGDLLDDEALSRGMAGASAVVHLAAKNIDHDGSGFQRVNVDGARRVAARAVEAGVRRLIYISSVGVYGHGRHHLADESTPVAPDTPFSRSKAEAEAILLDHHRRGDFELVILRHRFVYGEGDVAVIPRLMKAARKYPFWINGGRAAMSFIWAPDLAKIMARLAVGSGAAMDGDAMDREHPIYHVTDGRPVTYRQVITELCRTFGWKPPAWSLPLPLLYWPVRWRELLLGIDPEVSSASLTSLRLRMVTQDNAFSGDKLSRCLPDIQYASFDEGLRNSLNHYRPFADPASLS